MRPLKLTLRSFGPFSGEQSVDFAGYGDNAFLLIHGPTGAGKTSILDGICYALYGDPSGEKRSERYLRSQRAAADSLCEVELLFQVGPRRFFIRRTPPQTVLQKGKPREIKHQAELCQVDAQGAVIGDRYSKVGEVVKKVEELLGFTSDQFRQVVVLPQGEFRKLLLAKSDEKEQILEKLFGTGRFKLLEQLLKNRRNSAWGALKDLKAAVEGILTSHQVSGVAELEQQIALLAEQRAGLGNRLIAQQALQQQAHDRLLAARALEEQFRELEIARTEQERLSARKPEMELLSRRTEMASRALNLADLDQALLKRAQDLQLCRNELQTLTTAIAGFAAERESAAEQLAQARSNNALIPVRTAEKTRLEAQLLKVRAVTVCRSRLDACRQAEQTACRELQRLKDGLSSRELRLGRLTSEIEERAGAAGSVGRLQAELAQAGALCTAGQSLATDLAALARLQSALAAAAAAVSQAEQEQTAHQKRYDELHRLFISGQASLLARQLADGAPCPVCGSPDHPAPAPTSNTSPSDKELERARKQVADAFKKLQAAAESHAGLESKKSGLESGIAKLRTQLGTAVDSPLTVLQQRQRELQQCLDTAQASAGQLEVRQQEREQLQALLVSDRERLTVVEQDYGTTRAELEGQRTLLASLLQEGGDGDLAAIEQQIAAIDVFCSKTLQQLGCYESALASSDTRLASAVGRQQEKQALITRLEAEQNDQEQQFAQRLVAEGFASRQEYYDARLPRERIEQHRQLLDNFGKQLAAAVERTARAEGGCNGIARPDLAAVTEAKAQADLQAGMLQQEAGLLEGRQKGLEQALQGIGEKGSRMAVLEQEYAVAGRLADLAGGQNPLRMTLQRYVLAALFEEVAIAASQRLARMSRGRYHLVRSEAPRDGKATGGLDLDVTDDYIGEKRPAFTLSGGESFLASLSLALGLSDVVMAQSGGRYLDCIFIDEGFGSLDGESLDFALNTLVELHRSGRVIGIISHVAELKERISSRIEVVASKEGSRIVQQ